MAYITGTIVISLEFQRYYQSKYSEGSRGCRGPSPSLCFSHFLFVTLSPCLLISLYLCLGLCLSPCLPTYLYIQRTYLTDIFSPPFPPPPLFSLKLQVMLLNVARWLRTSSIVERDVYCAFHPEYSAGRELFDCSRKLVWGDRELPETTSDPQAMSPAPALTPSNTGSGPPSSHTPMG